MLNLNSKQASHQRGSSDLINTSFAKAQSIDDSFKITLVIHYNPKLEKLFPNDFNANIDIKCGTKKYSLNSAYLRVESGFFSKVLEENKDQKEIQLDSIKFKESDEPILEKILRCLYGGKSIISQGELYSTYMMCKELKIEKLVNLLKTEILKNFSQFNFFTVFQLAVIFNEYDLLKKSQDFLEDSSFEILKDPQSLERKNFPYPLTFVDLDQEAVRQILLFNKDFSFLNPIDTFELIKEYWKINQSTSDINSLVRDFLPQDKLSANEYAYIANYLPLPNDDQSMQSMRATQSQESNIIVQLESQNIYLQKKVKEMENQNQKLQDEMVKMKQEIEQKTDDFNKKEQALQLKLSNIENSIKQFEQLDKGKEQEYNRRMQKLFRMFKERENQLVDKERQYQDLFQIFKNLPFQNQFHQSPPPPAQSNPDSTQNGQMQQMKSHTHQGFFNRPSSLQNYPDTLLDNHKMKSSDSSLMTTQNSIMYVTGGMQQSQIVPLSELDSINQSYHNKALHNKLTNFMGNNSQLQHQRPGMNNFMSPVSEKPVESPETKGKGKSTNSKKLINSVDMNQKQNEPITQITGYIENDEDLESVVMGNFLTFQDESNVLDDSINIDYKTILSNFFELSPFKKMSLELIYRASRDKLTKKSFDDKVCGIASTVVFIKSWEYFKIFGAYLSIPWSDEQGYQSDENAFLFSISENKKIPIKNTESALYQGEEHIFSFGTSDLSIFENGDTEEVNKSEYPGDYQEIKLDSNIPLNCLLAGNKAFQIDELEVYKIVIQEDMDF